MRNVLILLTVILLATLAPAPAGSATKYKPCTLLTIADLEGALKAKATGAQKEGGDVENEPGPLQGETIDWCTWTLSSGSGTISIVLRVTRAIASVPQMAEAWYAPLGKDGETVERVKVAGAEGRIISVTNFTSCVCFALRHRPSLQELFPSLSCWPTSRKANLG